MRFPFPRAAIATVAALLTVAAAVSPASSSTKPDRSELQHDADALRALGVPGVQARLVTETGRPTVVTSGVGDLDTGRPVPPSGHFRIGSTNKTFVATVALQLADSGRLRLDEPVETYLPGVVHGDGIDGRRITVRNLLQHTSGLDDAYPHIGSAADYYAHRYDTYTDRELVERTLRLPGRFEPGNGWFYSNTNYILVGMIIERLTGRPWYVEVSDRIIEPLRLRHTSFPNGTPELPRPHARGYQRFEPGGPMVDVTEASINQDASGGIISTTADQNRFFRALLGGRLLAPEQLAEMRRTVDVDESIEAILPGARYGLGLLSVPLSCGGKYWTHGGSDLGYMTMQGVTPDGRRSVVLSGSGALADSADNIIAQGRAGAALVDNALCPAS